jgi:hypothetical protein
METESGWVTDDDLRAARERFAAGIPGYLEPAAYGVARVDDGELSFGEINDVGSAHRLPAAVLASVCGYAGATGTFALTTEQMTEAARLLAPAEAAVHWDHPNLWSWQKLLAGAGPASSFIAFYVVDPEDEPVDNHDAAFRSRLNNPPAQ